MIKDNVLIRVKKLAKYFPISRGAIFQRHIGDVRAVDNISFDIHKGETLGLVGESGCGKSTVGRTILQLYRPTGGKVFFQNIDLTKLKRDQLQNIRRDMQIIFQDPYASLNPRLTVRGIVAEPLEIHKIGNSMDRNERIRTLLELVKLNSDFLNRYPHEFSGGQRQRIGIARAIALKPKFIVCDEPVSALDVSIRAQIINLLKHLQDEFELTYLFIAHDLSMVKHISDRIVVMYLGKLMELATKNELYLNPLHPYTKSLLSAVPIPDPIKERRRERIILSGDVPSPTNPPGACRFHTRCPLVTDICREIEPEWREVSPNHWVACHLV